MHYDDATGEMRYPHHDVHAEESLLKQHLAEAQRLAAERGEALCDAPTGMREDFEALRWFELPAQCVAPA